MFLRKDSTGRFEPVIQHILKTKAATNASGAAAVIIRRNQIVSEHDWGTHSPANDARTIQQDSQFHVASVRKSYIGFAAAYALYYGFISSVDAPVLDYLPELNENVMRGTSIRHLLTHTHGLKSTNGGFEREFRPGESWAYRGLGVDMLCDIIHKATGKTVSQILSDHVFEPLGLKQTGWYRSKHDKLVDVVREPNDPLWATFGSVHGDKMNMYVSARDLAYWGCFHLTSGQVLGEQIVPQEIIKFATSLQSPVLPDRDLPQNGFLWFVKGHQAKRNEIGDDVPEGSYQILGYTGVTLLVIPKFEIVAVRLFNSWGSPSNYDYLEDVREFGNCVMRCLG